MLKDVDVTTESKCVCEGKYIEEGCMYNKNFATWCGPMEKSKPKNVH